MKMDGTRIEAGRSERCYMWLFKN